MKNKYLLIIFIVLLSVLVIYLMNSHRINQSSNKFTRKIVSPQITFRTVLNLPDKSFGLAGRLDNKIYLNHYSDRLNLQGINYSLKELDTVKIRYPSTFHIEALNIYKDVLFPYIFCTNHYGDISLFNGKVTTSYKIERFRFDFIKAVSPTTIIVRARYPQNLQNNRSIAKIVLSKKVVVEKEYPLPNKRNGVFTNDGMLIYDKDSHRILYLYFYRGEILNLDTNLNFKYLTKTIDTVKEARTKAQLIPQKGRDGKVIGRTLIQTSPPRLINTFITSNNNKAYVLSLLKADNELESDFESNQIIDTYNITDGKYISSFYIPKYKGIKLRHFQIKGNTLIAIYGAYLVNYRFVE